MTNVAREGDLGGSLSRMDEGFTEVEFGGQKVMVPKGGYYDRFRSNPDLDEVARDPAVGNIDFFRRIPKQQVPTRLGPAWAPNFYYRSSIIQVLFAAPISRLGATLPAPLEPLRAVPGFGLVAVTFFAYAVCDNDPYNEVSVAVVIRRPGARGSHALELLGDIRRRSFFAHVLALPVNTEIARVRGVYGYQLPKWRTDIDLGFTNRMTAGIAGSGGAPDLTLDAPRPTFRDVVPQSQIGTNTMINLIDGEWHQTSVQSNVLSMTSRLFPRDVTLQRHGGPISQLLDGLGASRIVRLDAIKDAQLVLNMPRRLRSFDQPTR